MLVVVACLVCVVVVVVSTPWDSNNDPRNIQQNLDFTLDLPSSGQTTKLPWSDTWWPNDQGGIANRWNSPGRETFNYPLLSLEQLKTASQDQIAQLSPAEKLDILNQRYDYPTVNSEWMRCNPSDPDWEGICHGWTPASLHFDQPSPTTYTNPDGITVPFGTSDVTALLSFFSGEYSSPRNVASFVGVRCNEDLAANPSARSTPNCMDANAGAFHVLLSNRIGRDGLGMVVDRDRSIMVWNQPFYRYNMTVHQDNTVDLTYCYAEEVDPHWFPEPTNFLCENLQYKLDLNGNQITGGDYNVFDRPDFIWIEEPVPFYGYFAVVDPVYRLATNKTGSAALDVRPRAQAPATTILTDQDRYFGVTPAVQPPAFKRSFSIPPTGPESPYSVISFPVVKAERFKTYIRVFEGVDGDGPLVAVLHGKEAIGAKLKVNSLRGVMIIMSTDKTSSQNAGFLATWDSL